MTFPARVFQWGTTRLLNENFLLSVRLFLITLKKKVSAISFVVWVSQVKELCDVNIINVTKNTAHLN